MRFPIIASLCAAMSLAGCATTQPADDALADALSRQLAGESQMQGAQLDEATQEAQANPLGSAQNPVRASTPQGQRDYLARLRCADGDAPQYRRIGNYGIGIYGNIVDGYAVTCADGKQSEVVMDMYHRGYVERRAVPGFTIAKP